MACEARDAREDQHGGGVEIGALELPRGDDLGDFILRIHSFKILETERKGEDSVLEGTGPLHLPMSLQLLTILQFLTTSWGEGRRFRTSFHTRLTTCAATSSFFILRSSSHH